MGKLFAEPGSGNKPSFRSSGANVDKNVVFIPARPRPLGGGSKENLVSPGSAPVRIGLQREFSHGSQQEIKPLRRTSVPRQSSVPDSSPQSDVNAGDGPFNFRQRLRKTDYAPTDTLKKMKESRSQSIED